MEQQIIRIDHNRLPPPSQTQEHAWPKRVGEGGSKRLTGISHLPPSERRASAHSYRNCALGILAERPRQPPRCSTPAGSRPGLCHSSVRLRLAS